jgi:WD40 repeat protein
VCSETIPPPRARVCVCVCVCACVCVCVCVCVAPRSILWHPVEEDEESKMVLSLDDNTIKLWDIEAGGSVAKETGTISLGELQRLTTGCWNPNNTNEVVAANDTRVQGWDLRSLKETFSIPKAHSHFVRDLDYNPNKLYLIATGGDDCSVKFWDTRKSEEPLKVVKGHSHWVWNVEYNRFRDQLVLSSSTDSSVNLWKIATLSSDPLGIDDYRDAEAADIDPHPSSVAHKREDYLIKSYDVHEESVYSVAWGCYEASPYVFASLSYDGRVVINQVPEEEIARIQEEM